MNNITKAVVLLTLLFCGFPLISEVNAQTVIKVVGNNAPPFRIFGKNDVSGIYFDVMKEIGKRLDVAIEFDEQPFTRALFSIEHGSADIICGPMYNHNREQYMTYTKAELPQTNKVFYVHPDSPTISKYEDLEFKQIATLRGSVYFDQFDDDQFLHKVPVTSYEQALRKVWLKRDDAVIIPEQEADFLMKQLGLKLKKCSFVVEGRKSYIAISKKSPVLELQSNIEEAMSQIIQDGTMKKILDRYR